MFRTSYTFKYGHFSLFWLSLDGNFSVQFVELLLCFIMQQIMNCIKIKSEQIKYICNQTVNFIQGSARGDQKVKIYSLHGTV